VGKDRGRLGPWKNLSSFSPFRTGCENPTNSSRGNYRREEGGKARVEKSTALATNRFKGLANSF